MGNSPRRVPEAGYESSLGGFQVRVLTLLELKGLPGWVLSPGPEDRIQGPSTPAASHGGAWVHPRLAGQGQLGHLRSLTQG